MMDIETVNQVPDSPEDGGHGYYDTFYDIISPSTMDIAQVPLIKEALIYQLVADKLHVFVCGNPGASRKSTITDFMREHIAPASKKYDFAARSSEVGLEQKIVRLQAGWMQLDEIGFGDGDVGVLYDAMQSQQVTVDLHEFHGTFPAEINFYATSNPKPGKTWREYGSPGIMKKQMPIPDSLMRRFHISIFTRPYTDDEFDRVNRHLAEYKNHPEREWVSPDVLDWATQTIVDMRQKEVDVQVPEKIFQWLKKTKYFDKDIVTPVTNELFEGVRQIAKANARLRMAEETNMQDWKRTAEFIRNVLSTGGLTNELLKRKMGMD